jgi:hypothetical protein
MDISPVRKPKKGFPKNVGTTGGTGIHYPGLGKQGEHRGHGDRIHGELNENEEKREMEATNAVNIVMFSGPPPVMM